MFVSLFCVAVIVHFSPIAGRLYMSPSPSSRLVAPTEPSGGTLLGAPMVTSGLLNDITDADIMFEADFLHTSRNMPNDGDLNIRFAAAGGVTAEPLLSSSKERTKQHVQNSYARDYAVEHDPLSTRFPSQNVGKIIDELIDPDENTVEAKSSEVDSGESLNITYPNVSSFFENLARSGYDPRIRPNYAAKPVVITCSIFITSISRISESDMDYTVDFYFRQTWNDYRLSWDVTHQEDDLEEAITISGDYFRTLWRPDTFFVNEKTASFHTVTGLNSFIRIMPDGHVTQSIRLTIKASCSMYFKHFPLDHQRCPLQIESYSLPIEDVQYKWTRSPNFGRNGDFINRDAAAFSTESTSLLHFVIHGFRTLEQFSLREDGYNHSRLLFDIYLERNLGYYLIQIYVPSTLIVVISWISFWIPRNSAPARVTLGVTTVLTMVTFTSMGAKAGLPNISYLKAMDFYLLTSFLMVFVALIEYAVVSYLEKQASKSSALSRLTTLFGHSSSAASLDRRAREHRITTTTTATSHQSLAKKRQSIMVVMDDDNMTCECSIARSLPGQIEWASRFGFPASFVFFNLGYWYYYYFIKKVAERQDDEGFVPF